MEKIEKPRNPWLASVLNIVVPGVGQIYNGQLKLGLFIILISSFLIPVFLTNPGIVAHLNVMASVIIAGVLGVGIRIGAVIHSFIKARRLSNYQLQKYNNGWVYLLLCIAISVFSLVSQSLPTGIKSYHIPSAAMLPALEINDYIYVLKKTPCLSCPDPVRRGDIWVFEYPDDRTITFVKRIIGLPGDTVWIEGSKVVVNGVELNRGTCEDDIITPLKDDDLPGGKQEYKCFYEGSDEKEYEVLYKDSASHVGYGPETIPDGSVFVLGDNRDNSNDSRFWGVVPMSNLIGRFEFIYYSDSSILKLSGTAER